MNSTFEDEDKLPLWASTFFGTVHGVQTIIGLAILFGLLSYVRQKPDISKSHFDLVCCNTIILTITALATYNFVYVTALIFLHKLSFITAASLAGFSYLTFLFCLASVFVTLITKSIYILKPQLIEESTENEVWNYHVGMSGVVMVLVIFADNLGDFRDNPLLFELLASNKSLQSPLGHGAGSMLLIVSLLTLAIFLEIKIEKMNSLDGLTNRRKWFYRLSVFFGAFFVTLLFVNWLFRIFTQEKIIYTSHIVSVLGCMCGAILLPLAIILQNPNMKKHLLK